MNAATIMQEIEKLPHDEQRRVIEDLHQRLLRKIENMETGNNGDVESVDKEQAFADDESFRKAADKVFHENADLLRRLSK